MTLRIGDEVNVHCPECGYDTYLIVRINRYGRLFLGCPNYRDGDVSTAGVPVTSCQHTQPIPTDIYMTSIGQPTLFDLEALDD